ncbi:uncharacterized protein LOC134194939 [Corticium candelabrum]|uniref:uncharacterized protein LOC134194939 n=1 Tax=Corticium candelabrum TaxID=121492 RepID=UPI002E2595D1|nr:uncharacterized protein LOC134194939 [Corticium candelabrum]
MAGVPFIDTRPDFSLYGLKDKKTCNNNTGTKSDMLQRKPQGPPSSPAVWGPPAYVAGFENAEARRKARPSAEKELYGGVTSKVGSFENFNRTPGGSRSSSRPGSALGSRRSSRDDSPLDIQDLLGLSDQNSPTNKATNEKDDNDDENDDDCEYDTQEVRRRMMRSQSAPNVLYNEDGLVKILSTKLTFKQSAQSRIGSRDNADHQAGGGNVKILNEKLKFRKEAKSRTDSGLSRNAPQRRPKLSLDSSATQQRKTMHRTRSEGSYPVGLPLGLRRFSHSLQHTSPSPTLTGNAIRKVGIDNSNKLLRSQAEETNTIDVMATDKTSQSSSSLEVLPEAEEDEEQTQNDRQ